MSALRMQRGDRFSRLTLDRPSVGNAIDLELARGFRDAVEMLASATGEVVLLDASGPLFCGGGDVAEMDAAESPADYVRELADTMHSALLTIAEAGIVVVAAVNGAAAGAGLSLVLNADIVVAADSAAFVSAYSAVGLSPDCGASYLLPRAVGAARASELVFAGRRLDAATALEWGLVNRVVPGDELETVANEVASRVSRTPRAARAASKRLLTADRVAAYRHHLDAERDAIALLAGSEESRELRRAFAQKGR